MSKNYQVIGFSVPKDTAKKMDTIAKTEQRTKSELFREMFRVWNIYRKREDQMWDDQISEIIAEVNAEKKNGKTLSEKELHTEFGALSKIVQKGVKRSGYTDKQLKKLGYVTGRE